MWQAFRELYANTIDENGVCFQSADEIGSSLFSPQQLTEEKPARTLIIVESEEFARVFEQRDSIFLNKSREIVVEAEGIANVSPNSSKHLYFRGIRAYDLPEKKPAIFTYNITQELELTEDRTIKEIYWAEEAIKKTIIKSEDKVFIEAVLTAPEESLEGDIDFTHSFGASQVFAEVIRDIRHKPTVNKTAVSYYSTYIAPPKPLKIDDAKWAMILEALEEAGSKATVKIRDLTGNDESPMIKEFTDYYLHAMQRKFDR